MNVSQNTYYFHYRNEHQGSLCLTGTLLESIKDVTEGDLLVARDMSLRQQHRRDFQLLQGEAYEPLHLLRVDKLHNSHLEEDHPDRYVEIGAVFTLSNGRVWP